MSDYLSCSAFSEEFILIPEFKIVQEEIIQTNKSQFEKKEVVYNCVWRPSKFCDVKLPFVVIPIRNNIELIKHTFENFKSHDFFGHCNIILVDDRSEENLEDVSTQYGVNYLRVDNSKGFNFSMLNNIAALIAHKLGGKELILWNSDLWLADIKHFHKFLKKHRNSNSTISGSKLLYPIESLHSGDSVNIKEHFPDKTEGRYKGTVQFGGTRWVFGESGVPMKPMYIPMHYKRFADKDNPCVNCDTGTEFVTGALQIINLDWFIKVGGLNPSLSKIFQDTDLCLRAIQAGLKVMYFGKNIHFYHDESYNHFSNNNEPKIDKQFVSDNVLFTKIWANKIPSLIF